MPKGIENVLWCSVLYQVLTESVDLNLFFYYKCLACKMHKRNIAI